MKNITSKLRERITLLTPNLNIASTTAAKYTEALKTRAYIRILKSDALEELYEVIMPKPPFYLKLSIIGFKWNEKEYFCNTILSDYKERFLIGKFTHYQK